MTVDFDINISIFERADGAVVYYWLDKQCLMWYIDDSECACPQLKR